MHNNMFSIVFIVICTGFLYTPATSSEIRGYNISQNSSIDSSRSLFTIFSTIIDLTPNSTVSNTYSKTNDDGVLISLIASLCAFVVLFCLIRCITEL
jgi:hypothetical protein